jgi:hypothetical protein
MFCVMGLAKSSLTLKVTWCEHRDWHGPEFKAIGL